MANLKRRPDKDLNHDNWDEEEVPEEKGEFRRANEDDLRNRRIIKGRRKLTIGNAESAASPSSSAAANPFSSFAFGIGIIGGGRTSGASTSSGVLSSATSTPAFSFGLPANPIGLGFGPSVLSTTSGATVGATGSLFKIAGITPSSEPPTRASADSSTTDPSETVIQTAPATNSSTSEVDPAPEVGGSESDGIAEESSNSSSLPWNVSARQRDDSNAAIDSNNMHGSGDNQNNPSWLDDADDLDAEDKEASVASSEAMMMQINPHAIRGSDENAVNANCAEAAEGKRTLPATSSAPADSSESSSSNHHPHPTSFNFGGTSFSTSTASTIPSGSLFQPFQNNNPSSSTNTTNITSHQQPVSSFTSPESSGIIVRSSLEDDLADYENDTTSSSNKLPSEEGGNEVSDNYEREFLVDGEDREAEADLGSGSGANEEREAEGVDS